MLMTIGGLFVAVVLLAIALIGKRTWLRNFVLGSVTVWLVFYAAMLLGFSMASREKNLELNEAKEYCGFYLDCHMHTAVTGVRTAKTLGDRTANGNFYIVKVKVFSDAKNPNITLRLVEPTPELIDEHGHIYRRVTDAENLLPTAQAQLGQDIKNKETVEKEIVFDLPADVKDPRLDIRDGNAIDQAIDAVLIDNENSICHKRNYFKLEGQDETASQNREQ